LSGWIFEKSPLAEQEKARRDSGILSNLVNRRWGDSMNTTASRTDTQLQLWRKIANRLKYLLASSVPISDRATKRECLVAVVDILNTSAPTPPPPPPPPPPNAPFLQLSGTDLLWDWQGENPDFWFVQYRATQEDDWAQEDEVEGSQRTTTAPLIGFYFIIGIWIRGGKWTDPSNVVHRVS
jgi:hypothetical protein